MKRSSGIILPVYSLPSPHGIGTLGKAARAWVDFLAEVGQAWWQILPVGPTSYGDSPYQSPSTFAGNPYFIDLDDLVAEGLLTHEEVDAVDFGDDPAQVDYGKLYEGRPGLLAAAADRGLARPDAAFDAFCRANADWLDDYALFMAVKRHFGMKSWTEWPDDGIRLHQKEAVASYRQVLWQDVRREMYVQYLFFTQWGLLFDYAHQKGVGIIGDLPVYVALDSADVWSSPSSFQLDENGVPVEVAGVPGDYFNADGQLWGNPLYDYASMAADHFSWWVRRIRGVSRLYDVVRIDHFRGLESYWAVPRGNETARVGRWVKAPGMALVGTLMRAFPDISFIAEDLGYPTPEVRKLLADSGFPGMKVLEFAFDPNEDDGAYRPHTYTHNCVCYTGTHDNAPLMEWKATSPADVVRTAEEYLGISGDDDFVWGFVRGGMASVADLFVAQMQDYLELGAESRTNVPGTLGTNWRWRLLPHQITPALTERIARMTTLYGRKAN